MKFRQSFFGFAVSVASVFACCGQDDDSIQDLKKKSLLFEEEGFSSEFLLTCNGIFSAEGRIYTYRSDYEKGWYCNFCLKRHSCQISCPYTGKEPPKDCK